MRLLINQFSGLNRKLSPRLLSDNAATDAENCRFDSGNLAPAKSALFVASSPVTNPKTIYFYNNQYWFTLSQDTEIVGSLLSQDDFEHFYLSDSQYPKISRSDVALSSPPYPSASYRLNIPTPSRPAIAAIEGTPTNDEDSVEIDTAYIQTFVDHWGREGPISPVSAATTIKKGNTVKLNLGEVPNQSGTLLFGNAHRRIYRLVTNGISQTWAQANLEASTPIATTQWTDLDPTGEGGVTLPDDALTMWQGAPDDNASLYPNGPVRGLCSMPDGSLAGFAGNTVYRSMPYVAHRWPVPYERNAGARIVAIAPVGDGLAVLTEEQPYLLLGADGASSQLVKLETRQACVSKRSVVDVGGMVIYASPDGLVGITQQGASLLTEGLFTSEQWRNLYEPSTILAAYHEGRYIAAYGDDSNGFIFDVRGGANAFSEIQIEATALHNHLKTDSLYIASGSNIARFDSGSDLSFHWKSKDFVTPSISMAFVQVEAEDYPVTASVYANNQLLSTLTIGDRNPHRLPVVRGTVWSIALSGSNVVHHAMLTNESGELL